MLVLLSEGVGTQMCEELILTVSVTALPLRESIVLLIKTMCY